MFSDHLKKIDEMPFGTLFAVAAGLVFVCQLVALVLVLNGQVEKSHLREAHYNSAQVEIADCSKTYSGVERRQCIEQATADFDSPSAFTPETEVQAVNQPSEQTDDSPSAAKMQGYLQATFTNRQ
jgi:hypothetical protein